MMPLRPTIAMFRGRDESLTASEAEFAGPWKLEPVPGHPGAVAVLRVCESLAEGDEPFAVFLEEETARICIAILPGVVGAFLLQHAIQGWCPPIPILRYLSFRTAGEIDNERQALIKRL